MTRTILFLALALTMGTNVQRDIAEQLLEDEEIWSTAAGRLGDSEAAFFIHRAEAAATALAGHAESMDEAASEAYLAGALSGENGVRVRLKSEIDVAARTGALPTTPLVEPAPWHPPTITSLNPKQIILGLVAAAALVLTGALVASRVRGRD